MDAPELRSGTLTVRPWRRGDRAAWMALFGDVEVVRWMGDGRVDEARDAAVFERLLGLALGPQERFAFVCAAELDGDVVGHVELKCTEHSRDGEWELVYALARRCWGRGHGSALAGWALATARAHGRRAIATVSPHNAASLRVLERLGFVRDAARSAADVVLLRDAGP